MKKINVLFVDDEAELVAAWVERLEFRGIEAVGVTNAEDAFKQINENNFDVIVLDIKMPGQCGISIMKEIVKDHPNLQVILITGHQCTEEASNGMLSDSFDCLLKPVDIDVLVETIKEAASKHI